MDACLPGIPLVLPRSHFRRDLFLTVQSPIQALAVHDADLRLRHVQPTPVLGRVVELDLVQQPPGLRRRERLIEAGPVVRVEVVLHQPDLLGPGVVGLDQLPHALGIVPPRTPLGDTDVPPAPQRLTHQELVADPFTLVLVIHSRRPARPRRAGRPDLAEQLLAGLVEADHRIPRVVGPHVGLDHVFHPPDELGVGARRDAPGPDDPRLDVVFFRAWRTVSTLTVSTSPSTTISSASSCKVQWQRPGGGSLHARRINFCSTSPLILTLPGRAGWGLGSRAAQGPSVTKRLRTRSMVRRLVPRAATTSSSRRCEPEAVSASRRMRAWVSRRAAPLPAVIKRSRSARSSEVRVTRYLSIVGLLLLRGMPWPNTQETRSRFVSVRRFAFLTAVV